MNSQKNVATSSPFNLRERKRNEIMMHIALKPSDVEIQSLSAAEKQHRKHWPQKLLLYFVLILIDCELFELLSIWSDVFPAEGEKQGNRVGRLKIGTAFLDDILSAYIGSAHGPIPSGMLRASLPPAGAKRISMSRLYAMRTIWHPCRKEVTKSVFVGMVKS